METWGRPGENYRKEEIRGGGWKKWRRKNRSNGRGGNGAGWIGEGEKEGRRGSTWHRGNERSKVQEKARYSIKDLQK